MAQINKFGFPRQKKNGSHSVRTRTKEFHGFKTGDIVRAIVPTGKNQGTHVGRVTVRAGRVFDLTTTQGKLQSINWKYFEPIWKTDGYAYVHKIQRCPLMRAIRGIAIAPLLFCPIPRENKNTKADAFY
ncbi:MAG: hypothetical protein RID09_00075 [Coleofasciculus sp. G1-WW12-02]|uniref:hypothetical protein n=1 Tax=Coleofasciculus sp. G1-WW12-02 TaxID=3068483 RepID=UPI0032FFCB9B